MARRPGVRFGAEPGSARAVPIDPVMVEGGSGLASVKRLAPGLGPAAEVPGGWVGRRRAR